MYIFTARCLPTKPCNFCGKHFHEFLIVAEILRVAKLIEITLV